MKANSSKRKNSACKENNILDNLATKVINRIAKNCGYTKRNTGKISPKNLIIGFMLMASKLRNTYTDWSIEIGILEGKTISKQSLNERMNPSTEKLIMEVVEQQLSKKIQLLPTKNEELLFKKFNNVMIDDCTNINLPEELAEHFPGNVSKGRKKAIVKIHAMYNLSKNIFPFFHIHSFSNNDQSLSPNVLPHLKKGDLCIRDLGFLVLNVIEKLINDGIFFISRKNSQTNIYDAITKSEIDLVKVLRRKNIFDEEVLIGKDHQLKVRLVAIRLPDSVADERRRKARKDRDKRLNHSEKYYELLGYGIYITNIPTDVCSAVNIFNLYKLRWNIEIIFKCWKSCFSLEKLIHRQCKNIYRVRCMIYLMLLYIFLFHVVWWRYCEKEIKKESGEEKSISIMKMASFFRQHFAEIITQKTYKEIIKQLKTHCFYDKRKDRDNAKQFQLKMAA